MAKEKYPRCMYVHCKNPCEIQKRGVKCLETYRKHGYLKKPKW